MNQMCFSTCVLHRKNYRIIVVILIILLSYYFFIGYDYRVVFEARVYSEEIQFNEKVYNYSHVNVVENYYCKRKDLHTSLLGDVLFKNVKRSEIMKKNNLKKTFTILIWKYWHRLKNRHIYNFGNKSTDPLQFCEVKNCNFEADDKFLSTADAVVIHVQGGKFPKVTERKVNQRWIFLSDESPKNTFSWSKKPPKIQDLSNIFNWSMTYRTEADIPVPYGRTVARENAIVTNYFGLSVHKALENLVPNMKLKRKDVLISVLMSNCKAKHRMMFLKRIQEDIQVDVYGGCASDKYLKYRCPGHFKKDCRVTNDYLFYLVLENSQCREYLTEKVFFHAYSKGAIPIIYGPPLKDCENLLPPDSYLHADQFSSTKALANRVKEISRNITLLFDYHKWRNDFEVINEHGYFGEPSLHYCRVCEALNYNDDGISIYDEERLRKFLDPTENCQS